MTDSIYYSSTDVEQFTFFRLPKKLVRDRRFSNLSSDAKILYGILMDRMTLSQKNDWIDEEDRVYIIYTIREVMQEIGCSERKAKMLMAELDTKHGIGLIEKKRQGLGRPDMIYVRNFNQIAETIKEEYPEQKPEKFQVKETPTYPEPEKTPEAREDFKKEEVKTEGKVQPSQTCKNLHLQTCKNVHLQTCKNLHPNDTEDNENNINIYNQSINPSSGGIYNRLSVSVDDDGWTERETVMGFFCEILDYQVLSQENPENKGAVDEIFMLLTDICTSRQEKQRIGAEYVPTRDIRGRMLLLTTEHIRYVLSALEKNKSKIKNIRAYVMTCLYNAPATMTLNSRMQEQNNADNGRMNKFNNFQGRSYDMSSLEQQLLKK